MTLSFKMNWVKDKYNAWTEGEFVKIVFALTT